MRRQRDPLLKDSVKKEKEAKLGNKNRLFPLRQNKWKDRRKLEQKRNVGSQKDAIRA